MMTRDTRPSLIDRALRALAPGVAARRLAARVALGQLDVLAREYQGAARGRNQANWRARNSSANAEVEVAAPILRARARDLVRNNPIAANGVQILVSNLVGTGITPRADTGNDDLNKRIDGLWAEFAAGCDFHGHTDFAGLTALAVREMIEGGDALVLQRMAPRRAGSQVPLQIEVKEADHLDDAKLQSTANGGNRISQGIEYAADGRRAAYWLYPDHPGDVSRDLRNSTISVRVPASQVLHLFERQRTQDRGVPWLTPVMQSMRDMDDWQMAELIRKKTEACLVGVVISDSGEATVGTKVTLADGTEVNEFGPGMIAHATGASDIKFNQPASHGGVYEWHRVHLHIIASGLRMPYALLTGDLSQNNFSSSRVGLNEFHRFIEMMQWGLIIPKLCQPVWDWFILAAQLSGKIDVDRVPVQWAPPRFESVNPKQDAEADLAEVRAGFSTLPQMIAKRGYDPQKILTEQAAFLAKADKLSLVFDSDPRRVSRGGMAQPEPPQPEPNT
jgi:lambda family phage portal protein